MRKVLIVLLLAIAFLIGTVTGGVAVAGQQVRIFINGTEFVADPPPLLQEGRTFVPLRAVSEGLGANVTWDQVNWAVNIDTKPKRPAIIGDAEFREKVGQALDLLEQKALSHYYIICDMGYPIELVKGSNTMWKDSIATLSKNKIIIYDSIVTEEHMYNPTFLAGLIAHEACHAIEYKMERFDIVCNVMLAERIAYENELAVFRLLDAPQYMKDACVGWESKYDLKSLN